MPAQLKYVDPNRPRGRFSRAFARFSTTRLGRVISVNFAWKVDPYLLRASRGRVGMGFVLPTALLETRGAKSGAVRRNAVIYFHDQDRVTIIASKAGADKHPAWFHNLRAHCDVTFGGIPMQATVVSDETERQRLWTLADQVFAPYATYRRDAGKVNRTIPIVQLAALGSEKSPIVATRKCRLGPSRGPIDAKRQRRLSRVEHRIDGRRVVITGATSGIGRAAALELARRGASLTIVCRNLGKGESTVAEIERATPGASAELVQADLADFASVRNAAQELRDRYDRIHVLINNAGVHAVAPRLTLDGFDHMLASNYLGPFLLTTLVVDRVTTAAPARVIVVGSEAHRLAGRLKPECFEDLGDFGRIGSFRAYGRTKLLDILFAAELARRLSGTGVTANSLCPGTVATGLYGQMPAVAPIISRIPLVRTAEQGARMTVQLACDPALADVTGRYFTSVPGLGLLPPVRARRSADLQVHIWERTRALVELGEAAPL